MRCWSAYWEWSSKDYQHSPLKASSYFTFPVLCCHKDCSTPNLLSSVFRYSDSGLSNQIFLYSFWARPLMWIWILCCMCRWFLQVSLSILFRETTNYLCAGWPLEWATAQRRTSHRLCWPLPSFCQHTNNCQCLRQASPSILSIHHRWLWYAKLTVFHGWCLDDEEIPSILRWAGMYSAALLQCKQLALMIFCDCLILPEAMRFHVDTKAQSWKLLASAMPDDWSILGVVSLAEFRSSCMLFSSTCGPAGCSQAQTLQYWTLWWSCLFSS